MQYMMLGVAAVTLLATTTACNKKEDTSTPSATPTVNAENSDATATPSEGEATKSLDFDAVVLKVGNEKVTYREALLYLLQLKSKYEPSLGSDIWNYEMEEGKTFGAMAKEELFSQLTEIKIIKQQAAKLDIQLESDEVEEVKTNAKAYINQITKEDQAKYGITEEVVTSVLSDNYLAEKVFAIATNEVDTNISNEEAKQVKVQQLFVMTKGTDKNGISVELSEEEKKSALERAKTFRDGAVAAEDFYTYASSNSDIAIVEFTFGKGDYEELESAVFALKEGEISPVITTSTGYAIVKLISANDEDATRQKKEDIIKQKQDAVFASKYEVWSADYKVTQDVANWDQITFE